MMYTTREKKRSHSGSKEEWLRNGLLFQKGRKSVDKAEQLKIRTQTI